MDPCGLGFSVTWYATSAVQDGVLARVLVTARMRPMDEDTCVWPVLCHSTCTRHFRVRPEHARFLFGGNTAVCPNPCVQEEWCRTLLLKSAEVAH